MRAEVYPLEAESSVLGVSVLAQIEDKQFEVASPSFERRLKKRASQRNAEVAADQLWVSYLPASSCQLNNTNPV